MLKLISTINERSNILSYKQNLFNTIKLLLITVILVETDTVKRIIMPNSIYEYLHMTSSTGVYLEHIIISIVFIAIGALIFLKKA